MIMRRHALKKRYSHAAATFPVVENRDMPAGFTSYGRGSFRSLPAAQAAARRQAKAGGTDVLIVHDPPSRMADECWVVGRVMV